MRRFYTLQACRLGEIAFADVANGSLYRWLNSGWIVGRMAKHPLWVQQLFHIVLAHRARRLDYRRGHLLGQTPMRLGRPADGVSRQNFLPALPVSLVHYLLRWLWIVCLVTPFGDVARCQRPHLVSRLHHDSTSFGMESLFRSRTSLSSFCAPYGPMVHWRRKRALDLGHHYISRHRLWTEKL